MRPGDRLVLQVVSERQVDVRRAYCKKTNDKYNLTLSLGEEHAGLRAALAKSFIRKILRLKVEKRLIYVVKYVILKQTPLILK